MAVAYGLGYGYSNELLQCTIAECYKLANGVWVPSYQLGVWPDNGFAFNPEQTGAGRMITAGGTQTAATSEPRSIFFLTPDGVKKSTATIPIQISFACSVALNASTFIITVGWEQSTNSASRKTFYYNVESDTLTTGPLKLEPRRTGMCARLKGTTLGTSYVLIAGGGDVMGAFMGKYLDSTEYLDAQAGAWKPGPKLPYGMRDAPMLEHPKGGVLLLGGELKSMDRLDTIYHLPSLTGSWIKLPQKLREVRSFFQAIAVPDGIFNC